MADKTLAVVLAVNPITPLDEGAASDAAAEHGQHTGSY